MNAKLDLESENEELVTGEVAVNENPSKIGGDVPTGEGESPHETQPPTCDTTEGVECEETWDCPPEGTEDCGETEATYDCISETLACPTEDPAVC